MGTKRTLKPDLYLGVPSDFPVPDRPVAGLGSKQDATAKAEVRGEDRAHRGPYKCGTHKLRKLRNGTRLPYVCLECGKHFKVLNGILVARNASEEDDYFKRRREGLLAMLGEAGNPAARGENRV